MNSQIPTEVMDAIKPMNPQDALNALLKDNPALRETMHALNVPNGVTISEYDVCPEPILNGRARWWIKYPRDANKYRITVRNMHHPDGGPDRWAILKFGGNYSLSKNGKWEYQSSERGDDFFTRCRYDTAEEAINYTLKWSETVLKWVDEHGGDGEIVNHECQAYEIPGLEFASDRRNG